MGCCTSRLSNDVQALWQNSFNRQPQAYAKRRERVRLPLNVAANEGTGNPGLQSRAAGAGEESGDQRSRTPHSPSGAGFSELAAVDSGNAKAESGGHESEISDFKSPLGDSLNTENRTLKTVGFAASDRRFEPQRTQRTQRKIAEKRLEQPSALAAMSVHQSQFAVSLCF